MFKIITVVAVFTVLSINSYAQVTASATATANIVAPIAIANDEDMNFGNIAVGDVAGEVILSTAGGRTSNGGVTLPAVTGTVSAAQFTVSGEGNYTYSITLPVSHIITRTSGSETMTVDDFVSDPANTGTLNAGSQIMSVGATLNVDANQVAGIYTNATGFEVTVNYN